MNIKPLISIGLSTFDRPKFLMEAVSSVLNQSFQNFELIISNDYIRAPVNFRSLGIKKDVRIKILNQKKNLGELKNLNFMLSLAKGDWFLWLADDDLLHPDFLLTFYNTSKKKEFSSSVGFFSNFISAKNPEKKFPIALSLIEPIFYNQKDFLISYTSKEICLIGSYGVMRKEFLQKIGGMLQLGNSFSPYSDTLVPIMLTEYGNICTMNQPLVFLRTHNDSLSCKSVDFSSYTSASDDFLNHLNDTLRAANLDHKSMLLFSNMIKWFSVDELAVITRDPSLSIYLKLKKFISNQFKIYTFKLSGFYLFKHVFFIFHLLLKYFLRIIFKYILSQPFFNEFRKYYK